MALVLGKKNTRKIKIIAEQYGDFDTVLARHSFDVEFKIMPNSEWLEAINSEAMLTDLAKENMIGVDGVKTEAGEMVPFSDELKAALFDETWLVKFINEAFATAQGGAKQSDLYKKEKRKN
ncbi:MAG: hypothetical protein PSU93_09305 [Methylobacter sp.]|uniref:Uncharacterized protein n=1 Tax=Candidatus Methylobacter titanis TaxID=3053457 RepID=A0AA43Q6I6_9GAMM|nr:hypothetical protein [Candidatus Methylobacter titanis]